MEKRIVSVLILISDKTVAPSLNRIISDFGELIISRQGLPTHSTGQGIISLVLEGTTDQIGALTGQLGRLNGVVVKSVVLKLKNQDEKI